ncbi:YdiU family protein [uncultured Enterovirga sp.]|uniref:protein adenylyltransferase SelO n=1 Tax=uncultured Enterovirga sp. TaxID=2026352 RepID=UPI0035C97E14
MSQPLATSRIPFTNSYVGLPDRFFARVSPTPVRGPRLVRLNHELALDLGLDPDWLSSPQGVDVLAGKHVPEGAEPIAAAYAGHQFGNFVPQLGDGRAILLGEVLDRDGRRRDIQLKGSGPTPFSRRGDGRAALGPVLREYIVSEAMAALGIPTTRALAAVMTGEPVMRETMLPGAVFARVASSHVRVGTFQFFAVRRDVEGLRALADYVIARHYPAAGETERPYRSLLDSVIAAQAVLVARWLLVGFIHGVMNTDNMSIAGETIDYGPCAFMDAYDPGTVFSSIDEQGRYAYANQPRIALWNLTRLAETLIPLLSNDENDAVADAEEALNAFAPRFEAAYHAGLRRKLGLTGAYEQDLLLANDLLKTMAENRADFTLTFRNLAAAAAGEGDVPVRALFIDPTAFDAWADRWRQRLAEQPDGAAGAADRIRAVNPVFIPRNHRIEAVIRAATDRDDFGPFEELLSVLARPFEDQPAMARYTEAPEPDERVLATFCGT